METDFQEELQALNLPELPHRVRILGSPLPGGAHEELRFSPDGRILMASLYDGMSRAYDVETGELLLDTPSFQVMHRMKANPRRAKWEAVRFIATAFAGFIGLGSGLKPRLTPAGKTVAAGLSGPTGLADFDVAARKLRRPKGHETPALSPDARVWAGVDGEDDPLEFFDAVTGEKLSGSSRGPTCADTGPRAFTPDGSLFIAESKTGSIGIWETATGKRRQVLKGHKGDLSALAVSPDGALLASAGVDGALVLWEIATGEWKGRQVGWEGGLASAAFLAHQGRLLLAATDGASLALMEVPSLQPLTRLVRGEEGSGFGLTVLAASPDGRLLAVGRLDDTVHLLDVAALLAEPETIPDDPIAVTTEGPPTGAEDRRAHRAFTELLEAALEQRREAVEADLRDLAETLPPGIHRLQFWLEGGELTGDGFAWQAAGANENEIAEGSLASFTTPILEPEAMDDPRYVSAKGTPWDTIEKLFPPWFAARWRAAVTRNLHAVIRHSDGHGTFDLRTGKWDDIEG